MTRLQDLIARLLERKPTRRLGMLAGRAGDIKRHKWFESLDWEALGARKLEPPRIPKDDSAKRLRELTVRAKFGHPLMTQLFPAQHPASCLLHPSSGHGGDSELLCVPLCQLPLLAQSMRGASSTACSEELLLGRATVSACAYDEQAGVASRH